MSGLVKLLQGSVFIHNSSLYDRCPAESLMVLKNRSCSHNGSCKKFRGCRCLQFSFKVNWEMASDAKKFLLQSKSEICEGREMDSIPHVQTLKKFPKEELFGKVVMVRFDSAILLSEGLGSKSSVNCAFFTIKYLYHAGAKVLLVSNWESSKYSMPCSAEFVADYLTSVLQLKVVPVYCISGHLDFMMKEFERADVLLFENLSKFKEERANCSVFAEKLSSGVDIFVNDAFSQSHKVLASTVGIARFCYARVAGFLFEDDLYHLKKAAQTNNQPYVTIIGGANLFDKAAALCFLASVCDGLIFVGMMAFQIMHALGLNIPLSLVEHGAAEKSLKIVHLAHQRNIPLIFPKDFWCVKSRPEKQLDIFPAHSILDGWEPVALGPESLDEISYLLSKCKKIMWIGPVKFRCSSQDTDGASRLAVMLDKLSQNDCDVTVVGNAACQAGMETSNTVSIHKMVYNSSVVWEFLKGRKLPGLMSLDRAYPFEINWEVIFCDPRQPLFVDIGSGNGLFLLEMAEKKKDMNFLGLESNIKLVRRCLESVHQSRLENGYFIATDAASTFRSIVSSYPGELAFVSIQCPNPDFDNPEHRWRMLQRALIEAIADLLKDDGKVFLQSDIEAVAMRMKEQFMIYSKGKLALINDKDNYNIGKGGWLKEHPFGIFSDWEKHVIDRGAPMYRLMISKVYMG